MNKKIIFGILASFSLFSCFAVSDTQPLKSILKKPFYMSEEQASFVVEVGRISQDSHEELVSNSLAVLLFKHGCTSIVLASSSEVRIINETNAIEVFNYKEFEKVVGRGIDCSQTETLGVSQRYKLNIDNLNAFKKEWIPLMVPEA